jgi:hypothetical protein
MQLKFFFTFFIILILEFSTLNGQILNIDREVVMDTTKKTIKGSLLTSFNSDKLKGNLIDISNRTEIDKYLKNNYVLISQFINDLTILKKQILQNEGHFQLRLRDNDKRKYSIESYIQHQWNSTLGMEYRNVIGSNLRIMIFDSENNDLYFGLGLFHESEKWNFSAVENNFKIIQSQPIKRDLYRLNNYLKYAYRLNDYIDLTFLTYIQLPVNQSYYNIRWFLESNANFQINKKINFVIHWDHTLDNYRVVPISNFYYSLNFGIQLNF